MQNVYDKVKALEAKRKQRSAAETIQRVWRGYRSRRNSSLAFFQAITRGALTRMALRDDDNSLLSLEGALDAEQERSEQTDEPEQTNRSKQTDQPGSKPREEQSRRAFPTPERVVPPSTPTAKTGLAKTSKDPLDLSNPPIPLMTEQLLKKTEKEIFYVDLQVFMSEFDAKITYWPKIHGRVWELWDIWTAVRSQHLPHDARDWVHISESLGYDWSKAPDVVGELKDFFNANLREFEVIMRDFEEGESDFDGASDHSNLEDPESPEGLDQEEQTLPSLPKAAAKTPQSSSPSRQTVGSKRSLELSASDSSSRITPNSKRTRYARHGEIPSTPDEKTGITSLRLANGSRHVSPKDSPSMVKSTAKKSDTRNKSPDRLGSPETEPFFSPIRKLAPSDQPRQPLESQGGPSSGRFSSMSKDLAISGRDNSRPAGPHTPQSSEIPGEGQRSVSPSEGLRNRYHNLASHEGGISSRRHSARSSGTPSFLTSLRSDRKSAPRTMLENTFDLAPPSDSRSDAERMPPPELPTAARASSVASGRAQSPDPESLEQGELGFQGIVDRYISMGYPHSIVLRGLQAANMSPGEAGVVMESLMVGKGIPRNHQGIWTEADDKSLVFVRSNPSTKIPKTREGDRLRRRVFVETSRLEHKHGSSRMAARAMFLSVWSRPCD